MDLKDPLEHRSDENHGTPNLLKNHYFWLIIIMIALGILSHIFFPRQDATLPEAGNQAKSSIERLFNGDESKEEADNNSTKDQNGMNTLSGK